MKKAKRYFLSFILILFNLCSFSQKGQIDSLQIRLKTSGTDSSKINLLNELSRQFLITGDYSNALKYATEALAIGNQVAPSTKEIKKEIAKSLKNIGVIYWSQGNYSKALEYDIKALKIGEELADKKIIASALNNIGLVYSSKNNYSQALSYYLRSLEIKKEIGDKNGIANSLLGIGTIYDLQGDYSKSLEYYFQGFKIKEELGDKIGIAGALNNIGTTYGKQGDYSKALEHFLKALKIREEIGDKKGMSNALNNIGEVYSQKEQYQNAFDYINRSLELSKEIGAKEGIRNAYSALSKLYGKKNQPVEALKYYKLYSEIKDTLLNESNNKQIIQMQALYESEKKDGEIALLSKDKALKETEILTQKMQSEKQRSQRNIFIVGFIIVLLFSFLLINRFRIIRKQKRIIELQKSIVDEKNKDIIDSINYAKRIQRSFLPRDEKFSQSFDDYFILNLPKDVVSGDFYWLENVHTTPTLGNSNKITALAIVDCTGHGVPGALVSIVGNTLLNQTIKNTDVNTPADALNFLNQELPKNLKKQSKDDIMRDGMDMVVCAFDINSGKLHFSGANNPIYIISNGQLTVKPGDKQPISASESELKKEFTNHTFDIFKNDCVYLFTDGYADQFGGAKGKKFKYKQLQELLLANAHLTMNEQKEILLKTIESWKGSLEQVDDILVIGIRI